MDKFLWNPDFVFESLPTNVALPQFDFVIETISFPIFLPSRCNGLPTTGSGTYWVRWARGWTRLPPTSPPLTWLCPGRWSTLLRLLWFGYLLPFLKGFVGHLNLWRCFTFSDGSLLVSKLAPLGSLLDLINVTNKEKTVAEPLALHLTAEVKSPFLPRKSYWSPSQDSGAGAPAALYGSDPRRPQAGQLLGHRLPRATQSGSTDDWFWKSIGHAIGITP